MTFSNGAELEVNTTSTDITFDNNYTLTGVGVISHTGDNYTLTLSTSLASFTGTIRNDATGATVITSNTTNANQIFDAGTKAGGFNFNAGSGTYTLGTLTGAGATTAASGSTLKVGVDGQTLITDANNVYSGTISGDVSVEKVGNNTWTLTGANTYTGTTTVNAGTLYVTKEASLASSAITVNDGGTIVLRGSSTSKTYANSLDVKENGTFKIELTENSAQLVDILQSVVFSGKAQLIVDVGSGTAETLKDANYTLTYGADDTKYDFGSLLAAAISANRAPDWLAFENGAIKVKSDPIGPSVPEPATWLLLVLGAVGLLAFRRKK